MWSSPGTKNVPDPGRERNLKKIQAKKRAKKQAKKMS
jgi:hypothetical protein